MTQSIKTAPSTLSGMLSWLCLPIGQFDILATLSEILGAAWIVQREADCEGEVSIIVFAASDDDNGMPTFILYEKGGLAHVAIVQDDEWRTRPGFANCREAVAAIAAEVGITVTTRLDQTLHHGLR